MCFIGLNKFQEAFNDLVFILKDSPDSEEILTEIKNLQDKWKNDVGRDEFSSISANLEKEILFAKNPENRKSIVNRNKIDENISNKKVNKVEIQPTNSTPATGSGFKKIKIIEDTDDNEKNSKDTIDPNLSKFIFNVRSNV